MNIKNIFIAFVLLSSINLFCMDEKRGRERGQEIDIDAEFLSLTKGEFQNILNDSKGVRVIDRNIALFHAARSDYISIVKELIKTKNINLNIQNTNGGHTALMHAVQNRNGDITDLLIKGGADLNIQDDKGYTALMWAAIKGHIKMAELLIQASPNLNIRDNKGRTALMHAIANNHIDIMDLLIRGGADLNIQDNDGYTALMWAAVRGNIKMAELLIKACPNLNIQNKFKSTALMLAAEFSQHKNFKNISENIIKIIILLIRAGANINLRDNANKTFLDYIPEKASCKIRLVEEIQKQIDFSTLLRPAFVDLIHKEIRKGNVNIIDKNGKSALIWAILSNQEDIVKLLIDNKANLDIQDNQHRTALHYAVKKEESYTDDLILSKKKYIVNLLIDHGANLNVQSYNGYTPLIYAAFYDNIEIVELLIKTGADLNLRDNDGWTALMQATVSGNIRIVKLLIEKKANLNIQDNSGSTALILAAKLTIHPNPKYKIRKKYSPKIIELLIDNGADTTIKDSEGRTYADYVSLKTGKKIIKHRLKKYKLPYNTIIDYLF